MHGSLKESSTPTLIASSPLGCHPTYSTPTVLKVQSRKISILPPAAHVRPTLFGRVFSLRPFQVKGGTTSASSNGLRCVGLPDDSQYVGRHRGRPFPDPASKFVMSDFLSPTTFHPNMSMPMSFPMTRNPNGPRPRRAPPITGNPHIASATPNPLAFHPSIIRSRAVRPSLIARRGNSVMIIHHIRPPDKVMVHSCVTVHRDQSSRQGTIKKSFVHAGLNTYFI